MLYKWRKGYKWLKFGASCGTSPSLPNSWAVWLLVENLHWTGILDGTTNLLVNWTNTGHHSGRNSLILTMRNDKFTMLLFIRGPFTSVFGFIVGGPFCAYQHTCTALMQVLMGMVVSWYVCNVCAVYVCICGLKYDSETIW